MRIGRRAGWAVAALAGVFGLWLLAGAVVMATAPQVTPRGEFVDLGGRKLRVVCTGPRSERPVVFFEHGAFGSSADWAVVQAQLASAGVRSCAYDRAGLGFSDAAAGVRDARAIAADLERLIVREGARRIVLVGHSMAGVLIHHFAVTHPARIAGLVFVDASTPRMDVGVKGRAEIGAFTRISHLAKAAAAAGAMKPLYYIGDMVGLPPQAQAEKRHAYVSADVARAANAEVEAWPASAAQAQAAGPLDPAWPVAVVKAGRPAADDPEWLPAKASRHGVMVTEPGANHSSLLGRQHARAITGAILKVEALTRQG